MKRDSASHRKNGAATVEFALVLPVLLLMIFSTVDTCQLLHLRQEGLLIAYEGARLRSTGGSDIEVVEYCKRMIKDRGIQSGGIVLMYPEGLGPGKQVQVRISISVSGQAAPVFFFKNRSIDVTRYALLQ